MYRITVIFNQYNLHGIRAVTGLLTPFAIHVITLLTIVNLFDLDLIQQIMILAESNYQLYGIHKIIT